MLLILARDRVKLLRLVQLVSGESIPAGAIGEVVKIGRDGALVRCSGGYPPIWVNLPDLVHAGLADLMPGRLRRVGRWFAGRLSAGVRIATTALIAGAVGAVVTLQVQRVLHHC